MVKSLTSNYNTRKEVDNENLKGMVKNDPKTSASTNFSILIGIISNHLMNGKKKRFVLYELNEDKIKTKTSI